MDAERKAGLRRIVNSAIADNYEDELFTVDQCRDLLDALDAAEARAERAEAEWDRVGVCDTCDNLSEDLLDSDGHEQCSACTKLATMTAERDRLREALEASQWREGVNGEYCPHCGGYSDEGHTRECIVGCALNRPD